MNKRSLYDYAARAANALVAYALAAGYAAAALAQAPAGATPAVIEVRPGDSFSAIAARFTGDVSKWRQLYDPRLSGLPNPNLLHAGTRLEVVKRPDGTTYLRALAAAASATTEAAGAASKVGPSESKPQSTAVAPAPTRPSTGSLVLGVLPNIPAPALLAQYEHMQRYLERVGPDKVRILTAPNFKAFYASAVRGEYDLAVMAVHLARLAQRDAGLVPIVSYEPPIRALLVSALERPIEDAHALRGKTLAFANPESLVAMYGLQWLTRAGLQPSKDVQIKAQRTDLGVGRMVLTGEAAAAILSNGEFRQIPADESARLKVTSEIARISNFVITAHPRLGAERIARLKNTLKAFPSDTESGRAFTAVSGVSGIVDTDEAQLQDVDAFLDRTRSAMGGAK